MENQKGEVIYVGVPRDPGIHAVYDWDDLEHASVRVSSLCIGRWQ